MKNIIYNYQESLIKLFDKNFENKLLKLSNLILTTIKKNKKILLCGNGGSAANCNHIENDFLCVLPRYKKYKVNIRSLASSPANITCLANDFSYNKIFSKQISALGKSGDLLIVLSGSGNSKNIVEAIKFAKKIRMNTFSIVGYNGGECKKISNNFLHLKINDMQVCEDLQLIIFHICLRYLLKK